jgi:DNA-binding response OmpR family regulator
MSWRTACKIEGGEGVARIAIVEDDPYMREELTSILAKAGYEVLPLTDFHDVTAQLVALKPAVTVLDINLPKESGFEICKRLAGKGVGAVLVLTSRDTLQDELHALDLGADDYLCKPCHADRLLARVQNLLKRFEGQQNLLDGGGFLLDPQTFTLYAGSRSLLLSANEGRLLLALLEGSPQLVSKLQLCDVLWGTSEFVDENALQVNLTRLRKTLRELDLDTRIETVRGEGYRLRELSQ